MKKSIKFLVLAFIGLLAANSSGRAGDIIPISLEGGEFNISAGTSATKIINGVSPRRGEGTITIRAKWHSDTLIPSDFRRLKVELINPGGTVVASETGFSQHAPNDKTPKIDFRYVIKSSDARSSGSWRIKATNDNDLQIKGFNIRKGGDILSPNFASDLFIPCPTTSVLTFIGRDISSLTIEPNGEIEQNVVAIGRDAEGAKFRIKAKWHSDTLIPGDFRRLTIALLKPNGRIAEIETGYSQHAPGDKTPKIDFEYTITAEDTANLGPGEIGVWKLSFTNNSDMRIKGLNIRRLGDLLVPNFESTIFFPCR